MNQNTIEVIDICKESKQLGKYYGKRYIQNEITYEEVYNKVKDALDIENKENPCNIHENIIDGIIKSMEYHIHQKSVEFVTDWSEEWEIDSYHNEENASGAMTNKVYGDCTSAENLFIDVEFDKVFGDIPAYMYEEIHQLYTIYFIESVANIVTKNTE